MTRKVLSEGGVVGRLTTCTCDVFGMLVSLRKLPSASKPILCSHCVLVNVIEDSLDSPAERESYLTAYPALAGYASITKCGYLYILKKLFGWFACNLFVHLMDE